MNVKMDDCFQFGLGAFETISVVDGRPIFLDRHLRRLEDASRKYEKKQGRAYKCVRAHAYHFSGILFSAFLLHEFHKA